MKIHILRTFVLAIFLYNTPINAYDEAISIHAFLATPILYVCLLKAKDLYHDSKKALAYENKIKPAFTAQELNRLKALYYQDAAASRMVESDRIKNEIKYIKHLVGSFSNFLTCITTLYIFSFLMELSVS